MIVDDEMVAPGSDVEVLARQAQHHRRPFRRRSAEVERQRCLHLFGAAARPQVQHHHEIARCVERPGGARHRDARPMPGSPVEKESVRRARRRGDEPLVACRRIGLVVLARCPVVSTCIVAWWTTRDARPEFPGPHIAHALDRHWEDEIPEHVRTVRSQRVRRHRQHEVGLSQFPPVGNDGCGGRQRDRLRGARRPASAGRRRSVCGEPSVALEHALRAPWLPWRHHARGCHLDDLARVRRAPLVGQQGRRRCAAGPMARGAVGEQERCDVGGKGGRARLGEPGAVSSRIVSRRSRWQSPRHRAHHIRTPVRPAIPVRTAAGPGSGRGDRPESAAALRYSGRPLTGSTPGWR